MKFVFNPNVAPLSGFQFKESDGTLICGGSQRLTVAKVREYRSRNNLPPGNPEDELADQFCAAHPENCKPGNRVPPPHSRNPIESLKSRVLRWLNTKAKDTDRKFVSDSSADVRATTCKNCPKNTKMPGGCSTCKAAVVALRGQIIGPHRGVYGWLGGCDALGCDLSAAIHLDEDCLLDNSLPDHCWRKARS